MTKRNGKAQTLFASPGGFITATDLKLGNGFQIIEPHRRNGRPEHRIETPEQLWRESPPFADLVRMGRDYVAGKSMATIAADLNVNVRTIRRLVQRIGLDRRKVGGYRPQQIAAISH